MQIVLNNIEKTFQLLPGDGRDAASIMEKRVIRDIYTYQEAAEQYYNRTQKPFETTQSVRIDISALFSNTMLPFIGLSDGIYEIVLKDDNNREIYSTGQEYLGNKHNISVYRNVIDQYFDNVIIMSDFQLNDTDDGDDVYFENSEGKIMKLWRSMIAIHYDGSLGDCFYINAIVRNDYGIKFNDIVNKIANIS